MLIRCPTADVHQRSKDIANGMQLQMQKHLQMISKRTHTRARLHNHNHIVRKLKLPPLSGRPSTRIQNMNFGAKGRPSLPNSAFPNVRPNRTLVAGYGTQRTPLEFWGLSNEPVTIAWSIRLRG